MSTLVLGSPPPELEALMQRRKRVGADRHDEVWEGVLHMTPAAHGRHHRIQQQLAERLGPAARDAGVQPAIGDFNLGEPDDYRVPDGAIHRPGPDQLYYPTVALVVEILSPGDESWEKLPFFAAHDVDEVVIVDPAERTVIWLALREGQYPVQRSALIDLGAAELAAELDWP